MLHGFIILDLKQNIICKLYKKTVIKVIFFFIFVLSVEKLLMETRLLKILAVTILHKGLVCYW